jgi:hypothetical protein
MSFKEEEEEDAVTQAASLLTASAQLGCWLQFESLKFVAGTARWQPSALERHANCSLSRTLVKSMPAKSTSWQDR